MSWQKVSFVLAIVVVVAAGLARFCALDRFGLWQDELHAVLRAHGQLEALNLLPGDSLVVNPGLARGERRGVWQTIYTEIELHPPLFVLCLRGWMAVFGESDAALRALPALCSLITVVLALTIGWLVGGRLAGLLSVLFVGFSSFELYIGQEVRPYVMATMFGLLSTAALVWLERVPNRRPKLAWWVYGVGLVCAVCSHYSALALFAAHLGYYWLCRCPPALKRLHRAVVVVGVVLTPIWLLLVQQALYQARGKPFGWVDPVISHSGLERCWEVLHAVGRLVRQFVVSGSEISWSSAAVLLVVGAGAIFGLRRSGRIGLLVVLHAALLPAALGGVSLVFGIAATNYPRYAAVSSPAVSIALAVGLAGLRSSWLRIAGVVSLAFVVGSGLLFYVRAEGKGADLRAAAAQINQASTNAPDTLVLCFLQTPGGQFIELLYYLSGKPSLVLVEDIENINPAALDLGWQRIYLLVTSTRVAESSRVYDRMSAEGRIVSVERYQGATLVELRCAKVD